MKAKKKEYEELWSIRYLVRSITKNSDDYDKKKIWKSNLIQMAIYL